MRTFHEADWPSRGALGGLTDPRLQVLGERLLYTEASIALHRGARGNAGEWPDQLPAGVALRLLADESTVPWLTLPKAIRETEKLLADSEAREATLLQNLRTYLGRRAEEVTGEMVQGN